MRRLALAALAALAAGAAAACETPAAPCPVAGGVYHLARPDGPPRGLMLFLHGWGGLARAQIAEAAVVAPLLARGWAVAAPQGMPRRPGEEGGSWNATSRPEARDDVAFLRAVAADAAGRLALGAAPVVAAGFSGGGMMVWRLACDAPDAAFAYAPVAGLMWRPLPAACAGPVRLLHAHGWSDPVVPIEGRAVGGGALTQGDLFAGLDLMRAAAGCAADAPDAYGARGAWLTRAWTRCAAGGSLALALHPGGHVTPADWADLALDWVEALPDAPARP